MANLDYSDIVSSFALIISLVALVWNIVRDLLLDKVSIKFFITFGEIGNFKNSTSLLFAEAGSIKPVHKFSNIGMFSKIINTGRRDVVISSIGGELYEGNHFSIANEGLPKLLKPYEVYSNVSNNYNDFFKIVLNDRIKNIWAYDTKGKKWVIENPAMENLKLTANFIHMGKHK